MKHYTEALARGPPKVNPDAHKLYSNRAACYTKLGAWDAGLKDADECIALKPDFAKGYVRKVLTKSGTLGLLLSWSVSALGKGEHLSLCRKTREPVLQ